MSAEFIENIEAFLDGSLSREDLESLAQEQGIENLDEEIQWFKDSQVAIEASGLRDQLREVLPKSTKKEAKVIRFTSFRRALAVAASILVIAVAYWVLNPGNSGGGLYSKYEFVDPGLPVLMSQSKDHLLYDAMTYYSEANYAEAEQRLQQIKSQFPSSDTISYYLAASQLYQGKTADATASLLEIQQLDNSRYKQRADWLLVLNALKDKDFDAARTTITSILNNSDHEFFENARNLQQELNQE